MEIHFMEVFRIHFKETLCTPSIVKVLAWCLTQEWWVLGVGGLVFDLAVNSSEDVVLLKLVWGELIHEIHPV